MGGGWGKGGGGVKGGMMGGGWGKGGGVVGDRGDGSQGVRWWESRGGRGLGWGLGVGVVGVKMMLGLRGGVVGGRGSKVQGVGGGGLGVVEV